MTITLTVRDFNNRVKANIKTNEVFFVYGLLWLDEHEARLYSYYDDSYLPICDPEACEILRSHLSNESNEYLDGALFQTWVSDGANSLEIHTLYWAICGDLDKTPPSKWGDKIFIRPLPDEYDYRR